MGFPRFLARAWPQGGVKSPKIVLIFDLFGGSADRKIAKLYVAVHGFPLHSLLCKKALWRERSLLCKKALWRERRGIFYTTFNCFYPILICVITSFSSRFSLFVLKIGETCGPDCERTTGTTGFSNFQGFPLPGHPQDQNNQDWPTLRTPF